MFSVCNVILKALQLINLLKAVLNSCDNFYQSRLLGNKQTESTKSNRSLPKSVRNVSIPQSVQNTSCRHLLGRSSSCNDFNQRRSFGENQNENTKSNISVPFSVGSERLNLCAKSRDAVLFRYLNVAAMRCWNCCG